MDVYTRLDERGIRRDADTLHDTYDKAGDRAGRLFGEKLSGGIERSSPKVERSAQRMEKAVDKVADAISRTRVEQAKYDEVAKKSDATDRQKIERSEALAKAKRAEAAAVRAAARAHEDEINSISRMNTLNTGLSLLGKGTASLAIGAAAPTLAVVAGAAVTAAGSLALLPGAATAAAGAFGTLKIATMGFGDALASMRDPEKFSEALRALSPNAQQAAMSVQSLLPVFDRLKNSSQDALFAGVSGQLQELSRTLMPTVEKMTTEMSASFNEMFMGITDQLMSGQGQAAIANITSNITKAFDALAPAAAPFTQAMADIMSVGSDFLPDLARAATDAAFQFASFINEAKQSGQLKQWISEGLDAIKEVGSLVVGLGKAVGSLAPVAKEVLPVMVDALNDVASLLREHPGLIWGVVSAFAGWKAIQGVAALTTSLQTMSTLLSVGLPTAASTGATGIGAALAKVSVPTWLTFLTKWGGAMGVGLQSDVKNSTEVGLPEVKYDNQGRPYIPGSAYDPSKPQQNTWDPNAVVPGGGNGPHGPTGRRLVGPSAPFTATQPAEPGMWWPGYGKNGQKGGGFFTTDTGGGGGPKLPDAPVLPYTPPTSNAPTAALASAENSLYDAQFKVEEKKARLNQLLTSNVATDRDIQDARNDVARAEQDRHEAEMRLTEARQSAAEKGLKQLNSMADQLGDVGAKLDQDFGLSRGLPGLAENLTKFIANLAAAPLLGQLGAISAVNPSKGGYGAIGIAGAQGLFGPRFTGIDPQQAYSYAASAMGPAGLSLAAPTMLKDTGSVPSGPQSRMAASLVEQIFGSQLRGPIGGSRDNNTAKGTHDAGLSIDIPIGPDQMQLGDQIRDYLQSHAEELGLEYTIWRDQGVYPGTGGQTAFTTPGHQNHIDAKFDGKGGAAGALSAATNGPVPVSVVNGSTMLSGFNWDAVAAKESSGNWQNADTGGNGHFGGLQFSPSTWNAYGGQEFAPMPHQATREQQMAVADRTAFYGYNGTPPQGLGAWEVITNGSTAPAGITVNSQPPSAGWGQPTGPLPTVGPGGGYGITGGPGQAGGPGLTSFPGPAGPGVGAAAATPLGGLPPVGGSGRGGVGMASGGVADMAMQAGGMALDAMAPGAGQAAQTGAKLINRAIEFGTQAIGIGASGLMETLLPTGGSQLANSNWGTKILGGIAGAGAALPNTAGQSAAALAGAPSGDIENNRYGNTYGDTNITVNSAPGRSDSGIARDIASHQEAMRRSPGM